MGKQQHRTQHGSRLRVGNISPGGVPHERPRRRCFDFRRLAQAGHDTDCLDGTFDLPRKIVGVHGQSRFGDRQAQCRPVYLAGNGSNGGTAEGAKR